MKGLEASVFLRCWLFFVGAGSESVGIERYAMAAVPGAGMVMLVIVLESVGFPADKYAVGLALIFAVDRPLDMLRTVINVTGDATVSTVVAKSVGKLGEPKVKEWDDHYEDVK